MSLNGDAGGLDGSAWPAFHRPDGAIQIIQSWLILTLSLSPCSFSDSLSVYLLSLFAAVSDTAISTGEWSI
jgi:hypothetical protein